MPRTSVIFDIDGTLVDSGAFEGPLYAAAVRETLGDVRIRSSWGDYEHVTDAGIFRQVCLENGIDYGHRAAAFRESFGRRVAQHIRDGQPCVEIPGAGSLLRALAAHPDVALGIATGGWGHTARMKLAAASLDVAAYPFASSDEGIERVAIMGTCHAGMPAADVTVYVGDGPWDQRATQRLGWRFVGVGARLRGRCEHWLEDYRSAGAIDAILAR